MHSLRTAWRHLMIVGRMDEVAIIAPSSGSVFEAVKKLLRVILYPEIFVHANQISVIAFSKGAHGDINPIDQLLRSILYRYGSRVQ